MKFSKHLARATRAVHQFAVSLHVKSLRLTVAAAEAKARIRTTEADIAYSVASAANDAAFDADITAAKARVAARDVKQAAQAEAKLIGGAL